jgi:hypothetical protein
MESITSIQTGRDSRLVMRLDQGNLEFRHVLVDANGREHPTRYAVAIPIRFYPNLRAAMGEVHQFLHHHGLVRKA